jgi:hypothetical protein
MSNPTSTYEKHVLWGRTRFYTVKRLGKLPEK